MFRFEELEIWKLSVSYANEMYKLAGAFPQKEMYALADQLRRAAVSISNNIAEGSGGTNKDFSNFLSMAVKSALETVNILYIAENQDYISKEIRLVHYEKAEEIIRKIRSFRNRLAANE
ncbi:MAG: hypothetical protein A2951_00710 [Candidatus Buchananbacteria bacterium RIFCSPLOWO2_01_FULL_56_15]|uniref:Four helix bundle protein n=2 Tax=Candidatus Buchananiibacteriota TaxID=1817903 RepID=A0A1G1YFR9_9BACT|nr:MAG: hypothetical protein A3J59_02910 [Candidatus Buchananbacteria bacterium RIFCSPHIGHO2_02_FULL_56_16]OGY54958.1 MAG: hypothetical protein A2951_00710 [Candidatus Buchananbacteria bacterium RIFCSPLOWO2_01_FULL_56_15]